MKKFLLTLLTSVVMGFAINSYAATDVITPQVENFNSLAITGIFTVNVKVDQPQNIKISGDADILAKLQTEVRNGTLYIRYPQNLAIQSSATPVITIDMPELKEVTVDGNDRVSINQLKGVNFDLHAMGNQKVDIDGQVTSANLDLIGNIDLDAQNLIAQTILLKANGDSAIKVNATEELHVKAMGNVQVKSYGHPKTVTSSMLGNGHVEAMTN